MASRALLYGRVSPIFSRFNYFLRGRLRGIFSFFRELSVLGDFLGLLWLFLHINLNLVVVLNLIIEVVPKHLKFN